MEADEELWVPGDDGQTEDVADPGGIEVEVVDFWEGEAREVIILLVSSDNDGNTPHDGTRIVRLEVLAVAADADDDIGIDSCWGLKPV